MISENQIATVDKVLRLMALRKCTRISYGDFLLEVSPLAFVDLGGAPGQNRGSTTPDQEPEEDVEAILFHSVE